MSSGRFAEERSIYESYLWPGTDVLKNKLGIRDQAELDVAESRFVLAAMASRPIFRAFDLAEICAVHKHLLEDVYTWAGKTRNYTTGRGSAPFARPAHIESYVNTLSGQLNNEKGLRGLSMEAFSEKAAHYANELNAAHPFIDGNGRVTRLFITDLAHQAGFRLDIKRLETQKGSWYEVMAHGFDTGKPDRIACEIQQALTVATTQEVKKSSQIEIRSVPRTRGGVER